MGFKAGKGGLWAARRTEVTGFEPGGAGPSLLVARWTMGIRGCGHWPPGVLGLWRLCLLQAEASSLNLIYQSQKPGFFQPPYRICFLTLLV